MYFIGRRILKGFSSGWLEKHTNIWDAEKKFLVSILKKKSYGKAIFLKKVTGISVFCNPVRPLR